MNYEVEQKYPLDDPAPFEARLTEMGAEFFPSVVQVDRYFAHPCRDFVSTDEALRIRTVDDESCVTYKGPKIDATTKTRREIELALDPSDPGAIGFGEMLAALGFEPVATVRKERRRFRITRQEENVEGAIDVVDEVGTYVELELAANGASLDRAKQIILSLAEELNLGPSERRSYLELLLGT